MLADSVERCKLVLFFMQGRTTGQTVIDLDSGNTRVTFYVCNFQYSEHMHAETNNYNTVQSVQLHSSYTLRLARLEQTQVYRVTFSLWSLVCHVWSGLSSSSESPHHIQQHLQPLLRAGHGHQSVPNLEYDLGASNPSRQIRGALFHSRHVPLQTCALLFQSQY